MKQTAKITGAGRAMTWREDGDWVTFELSLGVMIVYTVS